MPAKKPAKKAAKKPALPKATAPKRRPSLAAQLEEIRDKLHAIVESQQDLRECMERAFAESAARLSGKSKAS